MLSTRFLGQAGALALLLLAQPAAAQLEAIEGEDAASVP